ncbi:MAG: DUF1178 family protein [Alphaproteobacteria bacterium]|nr:DUF1178 family protein [Alphaproteobacteria bacterium]
MIVFDLKCKDGHVFEAWFPDSAAFEKQKAKKAVVCPMCGNRRVTKAPMAPNISSGKSRERDVDKPPQQQPNANEMMVMLSKLRQEVEKNSDYVGEKFPEEARKIHYGETEKRNIYGEASKEEAAELAEEGVEFQRIPWVRHDS